MVQLNLQKLVNKSHMSELQFVSAVRNTESQLVFRNFFPFFCNFFTRHIIEMTTCKTILTLTTKEPKICHALATTSAFNLKLCHMYIWQTLWPGCPKKPIVINPFASLNLFRTPSRFSPCNPKIHKKKLVEGLSSIWLPACCQLGKILQHIRHFNSDPSLWLYLHFCIKSGSSSAKLHISHFSNLLSLWLSLCSLRYDNSCLCRYTYCISGLQTVCDSLCVSSQPPYFCLCIHIHRT